MSLQRILAIYTKDAQWAVKNLKLLALMMAPIILTFMMSRMAGTFMFVYSLVFSISFIGLLMTSYITTEEKRIGALKTILVSPLTEMELILGKFMFPLSMALLFGVLNFYTNHQMHLLTKPAVIVTLILTCGIVCFIGNIFGLFFKNEQELGIVAPFMLIGFISGTLLKKSGKDEIYGFFPDYHLGHLLEQYNFLTTNQILAHIGFQFVLFLALLLMTVQYVKYYFSRDSEGSRMNYKTVLYIPIVAAVLIVSGNSQGFFAVKGDTPQKTDRIHLALVNFEADVVFSPDDYSATPEDGREEKVVTLTNKNPSLEELTVTLKKMSTEELNETTRTKALHDKGGFVLAREPGSEATAGFSKAVISNPLHYRTVFEKRCNEELARLSFKNPESPKDFKIIHEKAISLLKASTWTCK